MPIDSRLREGLQRSMSSIDTDAELFLGEARRRGRRRLARRRATATLAVVLVFAVAAVAAPEILDLVGPQGRQPASQPTSRPTHMPASSRGASPPESIIGTWRNEYTCVKLVQAYEQAGIGEFAAEGLAALRMQPGPASRLASKANLCAGAKDIQRTQTFQPNGHLLRYQGDRVVDDCRCYQLIGSHGFVVLGGSVDPDISLQYRIDGETLTFEAVLAETCSSPRCRRQFAFAVGQYAVGQWHRVDI
jgi:hypothetical protein